MRAKRIVAGVVLGFVCAAIAAPPAIAAEEKTVLTYSIKEARAFLWHIHYPQSTFVTEKYSPCVAEDDENYGCDRARYNQTPNCPEDVALGRTKEAVTTPTAEEAEGGVTDDGGVGPAADWPRGNPVVVVHGLASGHIASTPEAGGFGSMYYVENSGRRETEAHVESDAFVSNRRDYEERCEVVDAFSETGQYPGPFNAHMLTRAAETPSVYSMAAFTTFEADTPPGGSKENVAIVKLWEADGRVHGLISSTLRGANLAEGAIVIDVVRSVVSFSSDGTKKGLVAVAKTEALGVSIGGQKIGSLDAGQIVPIGDAYLGVIRPVVQIANEGRKITIRAPGVFLAAKTMLNQVCMPEDPFIGSPFRSIGYGSPCLPIDPLNGESPFPDELAGNFTLGGKFFPDQVVYVAGALLDAGVGRALAPEFLPGIPEIPIPPIPPIPGSPIPPPALGPTTAPPPASQPVALPRFEVRELSGSAAPAIAIVLFAAFGFLGIMGRWSMRFAWARALSRYPPFPAFGWIYRAFLKG